MYSASRRLLRAWPQACMSKSLVHQGGCALLAAAGGAAAASRPEAWLAGPARGALVGQLDAPCARATSGRDQYVLASCPLTGVKPCTPVCRVEPEPDIRRANRMHDVRPLQRPLRLLSTMRQSAFRHYSIEAGGPRRHYMHGQYILLEVKGHLLLASIRHHKSLTQR